MVRELGGGGALSDNGGGSALLLWLARGSETQRMEQLKAASRRGGFAASLRPISGPSAGVRMTNGTSGQRSVGHDGPAKMAIRPVIK